MNIQSTRKTSYWLDYIIAGHPETSVSQLSRFASDPDRTLRRRVAENVSTPQFIQRLLATDPHPEVRVALAENKEVSHEILEQLLNDHDPIVRYELADNPHLPLTLLVSLAQDSNAYVAFRAEQTIDRIFKAARQTAA